MSQNSKGADYTDIVIVKNKIIKRLPEEHNFIGVNWFDYYAQNRFFLKSKSQIDDFGKTLQKYNIDTVRYPGGLNVLTYFWDIPNEKAHRGLVNLPKFEQSYITRSYMSPDDRMSFFSFMQFCKKYGIQPTIQINVHSYYDKDKDIVLFLKQPKYDAEGKRIKNSGVMNWKLVEKAAKSAGEQVKWVNENGYKGIVQYWEMGNEDYVKNYFLNCGYTGDEYAKVSAIFMREMLKANPDLKFIITSALSPAGHIVINPWVTNYLNNWTKDLFASKELEQYRDNIYSFSRHFYRKMGVKKETTYDEFVEKNLNDNIFEYDRVLNYQKEAMFESGFTHQSIFVNEFNVNNFQNKYMHTWLSALSLSKQLIMLANNPSVEHADYHNLLHQWHGINYGFGLFNYAKDFGGMKFLPYPAASVVSFINENFKGDVLEAQSGLQDIYISASKLDNTHISLLILNRKDSKNIAVTLNGFEDYKYLNNSALGVCVPYSFESFEPDTKRGNPPEVRIITPIPDAAKVTQDNNTVKIEMPAHSLVAIKLVK